MRLGSSIGDRIPLKISADDDEVRVLDELPGWMGVEGDKSSGLVVLGGTAPLRTKWRYEAYVDKEKCDHFIGQVGHSRGLVGASELTIEQFYLQLWYIIDH